MAAVLCGLLLLAGCAGSNGDAGQAVSPAAVAETAPCDSGATPSDNPYGGTEVDPPAPGEAVLVAQAPGGKQTPLTLKKLAALGTEEIQINEPFVGSCQTFTVVPLQAVLQAAGIPTDAGTLRTIALNDYEYDGSIPELIDAQAMIALQRAGQDIPVDQGGPIRIVFPDDSPMATNLDAWNWSLIRIEAS